MTGPQYIPPSLSASLLRYEKREKLPVARGLRAAGCTPHANPLRSEPFLRSVVTAWQGPTPSRRPATSTDS